MNLQDELARINALQWDKQPAAYQRLCSDLACKVGHLEVTLKSERKLAERLQKQLDDQEG